MIHTEQAVKDTNSQMWKKKSYNVMIDGKNLFDQSIKNDKIIYENIRKIATGQGDDCTTGCL